MLDKFKKILLHKNTGKVILVTGLLYTLTSNLYQEEIRKETWRKMIKEELALLNEKKEN